MRDDRPGRHALAGQLLHRGVVPLDTTHGPFAAHVLQNVATGSVAFAVARGDVRGSAPLLARIHSSCVTSETFGGCDCDCVEQLDLALERIADEERGVVFYLMQEGRGAGFSAKARDRMLVQASRNRLTTFEAYERMGLGHDHRRYDEVGHASALLGVTAPLVLLTNNPDKLTDKLTEFLVEFEKARSQFKESQIQLLLVQLGAVLAHLFVEKYGWSWTCAKDENDQDFYFIVSRDRKLMLQPWTFLQDCIQQPDCFEVVKNLVAVPELASQSDEVRNSDLQYQDIGMAFMAMGSLVSLSQGVGTILEDDLSPDIESQN